MGENYSDIRVCKPVVDWHEKEIAALKAENENLRQEARLWAQEARTQRSTVCEIYQVITGATGEPGDWNGAQPVKAVKKELFALKSEIERKDEALREAQKMAVAIEKCSIEPDKVYIHAGRIKQAAKQALQGEEE
jgi:hypothetical protein